MHPYKTCDNCHKPKPPEGGCQLRPVRWVCGSCWVSWQKLRLAQGLQTAAGVPLQCDEPTDFCTFRVGLFGLEKLHNVDRTVAQLAHALDAME